MSFLRFSELLLPSKFGFLNLNLQEELVLLSQPVLLRFLLSEVTFVLCHHRFDLVSVLLLLLLLV